MSKRCNGEGTIYKRKDGRWCGAYYVNNHDKPIRRYVYAKTQKEVKEKLKELSNEPDQKKEVVSENSVLLKDWVYKYLDEFKRYELKETTYSNYLIFYNKHIKESKIGSIEIKNLKTTDIQQYLNSKIQDGLSSKTVSHIRVIINSALDHAVKFRVLEFNPCKYTVLPPKEEFRGKILSIDSVKKLLIEAKNEKLYAIIMTTIFTGMRKGEVMALKWSNVDFHNKTIRVEGSLCLVNDHIDEKGRQVTKLKILEPKTKKSKRIIPLTDIELEILKNHKKEQEVIKREYADIYNDHDLVFAKEDGSFISQRSFLDEYYQVLDKYDIPRVRFHDLRHTYASMLLEAGESIKVIQELMGHSTITTTMDIYTHVSANQMNESASRLENLLETNKPVQ